VRLVAVPAALLLSVACGSASTSSGPGAAGSLPVLSTSAVPGVPSTTAALTVTELAKDASIPDLASLITSFGYVGGLERTFQGQSRHLTLVVSRALAFQDPSGAEAYVAFVHDNATAYFGVAAVQALDAQGRPGWQFTPAACACHMANPVEVGIVSSGANVTWLEINGPDATPSLLLSLLDPSKSAPATP
jgi:hypothetical protein